MTTLLGKTTNTDLIVFFSFYSLQVTCLQSHLLVGENTAENIIERTWKGLIKFASQHCTKTINRFTVGASLYSNF